MVAALLLLLLALPLGLCKKLVVENSLTSVDLSMVSLILMQRTLVVRLGNTKACMHGALRVAVEITASDVRARSKIRAMAKLVRM